MNKYFLIKHPIGDWYPSRYIEMEDRSKKVSEWCRKGMTHGIYLNTKGTWSSFNFSMDYSTAEEARDKFDLWLLSLKAFFIEV